MCLDGRELLASVETFRNCLDSKHSRKRNKVGMFIQFLVFMFVDAAVPGKSKIETLFEAPTCLKPV